MTDDQLKKIVPNISDSNLLVLPQLLTTAFDKYEINTVERQACFIAQIAHESGSFKYTKELASGTAYEGRKDLGNIVPGDGVRYKGRGYIQITGHDNYLDCSKVLFGDTRLLRNPEILEQPEFALESACWFWNSRKLSDIADVPYGWTHTWKGNVYDHFQWITIRINGGLNGYSQRLQYYIKAKEVLNA